MTVVGMAIQRQGSSERVGASASAPSPSKAPRTPASKTGASPMLRAGALAALTTQNAALALTMRYSRTLPGPRYLPSTAVLLCEVLKWSVSVAMLAHEHDGRVAYSLRKHVLQKPLEVAKLAVPAALYTMQNNLAYFAIGHLEATTYQLLCVLLAAAAALRGCTRHPP